MFPEEELQNTFVQLLGEPDLRLKLGVAELSAGEFGTAVLGFDEVSAPHHPVFSTAR